MKIICFSILIFCLCPAADYEKDIIPMIYFKNEQKITNINIQEKINNQELKIKQLEEDITKLKLAISENTKKEPK